MSHSRPRFAVSLLTTTLTLGALGPLATVRPTLSFAASSGRGSSTDTVYRRSTPAENGDTLALHFVTNGLVTIRGWGEPRVELEAHLGGAATPQAIDFARTEGKVAVELATPDHRPGSSQRYALEFRVPNAMSIDVQSENGSIRVDDGSLGAKHVRVGNGDITVASAAAGGSFVTGKGSVTLAHLGGETIVSTAKGDIVLDDVGGSVTAKTSLGNVRAVLSGDATAERTISLHASRGDIVVELPSTFGATIDIESVGEGAGRAPVIRSDWALIVTRAVRHDEAHRRDDSVTHASGQVGGGGAHLVIHADGGSVSIRRARD